MENITRLFALALIITAPLALVGPAAQASASGSISGQVWHDLDGDGVRDAGEPAITGQWMYIDGTSTAVQSDAYGNYEFTDLAAGSYLIGSGDRALSHGQGWTLAGGDSKSREANGKFWQPITLQDGAQVKGLNSGFATAWVDYRAVEIRLSKDNPAVGDMIDIVGVATHDGNVYDQFGGQLTLPDGLRVVERLGDMSKFYEAEPAGKVTGFWYDRRRPGPHELVGARVVVEKPLNDAEIRFEVWKGLFRNTDADLSNDVSTRTLTTS
jgi:hypothetical protein